MMVCAFLIILTVILPAARGILRVVTPGLTVNVDDKLPHCNITVALEVAKTAAHMKSYNNNETEISLRGVQ
jgi:hypothetical protein